MRQFLFSLIFVLSLVTTASAQEVVREVSVAGNVRVEDSTVLLQVGTTTGKPYSSEQIDKDIKEVYRTGFFSQVLARRESVPSGVRVVFDVIEKPAIRQVFLEGNEEIDDTTLKEKLNISARRFLDRRKLRAGAEAAKKYYESKGYYDTEITFKETAVEKNQVDLTFDIREGKKKVITEIVFEGNTGLDENKLEDTIKTSTYAWISSWITGSGILNPEQLEEDVKALNRLYLNNGYADAKVGKPVVDDSGEDLKVIFKIHEGPVFSFGKITASGTLVDNSMERTLEGISCETGDTFSLEKMQKDVFVVSEKYTDVGYAFANVESETNVDHAKQVVELNFRVDRGDKVLVNRINITGNRKTQDNVIRRSLTMNERELYSSSKIRRSQELLQRLGYFDEVTIAPEPSDRKGEVDLNLGVREAQTGSFSFGAGVSSGEGFILTSRIAENNLFGTGRSASFDVNTGSERQNFVLSFVDPRVNDTKWSAGVDALSVQRDFDDFDRHQAGGAFTVGHPLTFLGPEVEDDVSASLKYELLDVNIDSVSDDAAQQIKDQEGKTTASAFTPRLVRNTINNPLDPESGSKQIAEVELAGVGGDQKFWLLGLANTWYYPLWKPSFGSFVFSQRTRLDYGETFNGDDEFPLYRRMFPGGINSVRGYKSRTLGPKDENGSEFGGSKQLVLNFDLIYPIADSIGLKGVFFYDAGQAFDDDDNIDVADLRQAAGFGFRWRSPIAPIRIEFGLPIDKEEGEQSFITNFSFGSPL